jgi:anthranilate phosphoribosyltransferase
LKHALVVHGQIGMDELSITGSSFVWEVKNGELCGERYEVRPQDMGLSQAPLESIQGGTPEENAEIILRILSGEQGPRRDVVVMNAAAALLAGDKVENLKQGSILAQSVIDQGLALSRLEHLIKLTQEFTVV